MKMRITAFMMAVIFLVVPMAVLAGQAPVFTSTTIVPKSQFNIVLAPNEQILWTADQVTSDSDVAYVTGTLVQLPPKYGPLDTLIYDRSYTVNAKNNIGITMFWTKAEGIFTFVLGFEWGVAPYSSHGVKLAYVWRYSKLSLDQSVDEQPHSATVYATGHFYDKIIHTYPRIYAWITCLPLGQTQQGGSVTWQ